MTAIADSPPITARDLLKMPDGDRFELVNGELVERNMGWESEWIASNLQVLLGVYCREHCLGYVNGSNAGYQCFAEVFPDDPERTRKPDVSFIAIHRLTRDNLPQGHCPVVPDLVVEVISPNDLYSAVETKVDDYLQAGVRLVWVVDPRTESLRVHRANGSVQDISSTDQLSGEDVVAGFSCAVAKLFEIPELPA
jgi:Uma2 family endonuclease